MAKVLLVDTNFSSAPIYEEILRMGHEVHVVGGNPQDCLAKKSLHYWNLNYADTKQLEDLIARECFDFIVPGCTDRSFQSCVEVGHGRFPGFDSPAVNNAINNKALFRELAERIGLPAPRRQKQDGPLRWPLIVKPADAFSGKGITVLRDENYPALEGAIALAKAASASDSFIIEDYVEGQLHSHSAFVKNGRIIVDFVVQEDSTANPYVVDTSHVLYDFCPEKLAQLRKSAEALAAELKLVNGLLHTQFMANSAGVWLIELTRRCPGDLYSQLIELSTGYHYVKSYVSSFLGQDLDSAIPEMKKNHVMRHTITVKESQHFGYLKYNRPLTIERWIPLSLVGDKLQPSPLSRIGVLFCSTNNEEALLELYQATLHRNLYYVAQ